MSNNIFIVWYFYSNSNNIEVPSKILIFTPALFSSVPLIRYRRWPWNLLYFPLFKSHHPFLELYMVSAETGKTDLLKLSDVCVPGSRKRAIFCLGKQNRFLGFLKNTEPRSRAQFTGREGDWETLSCFAWYNKSVSSVSGEWYDLGFLKNLWKYWEAPGIGRLLP